MRLIFHMPHHVAVAEVAAPDQTRSNKLLQLRHKHFLGSLREQSRELSKPHRTAAHRTQSMYSPRALEQGDGR
jgi:hypothetical protein